LPHARVPHREGPHARARAPSGMSQKKSMLIGIIVMRQFDKGHNMFIFIDPLNEHEWANVNSSLSLKNSSERLAQLRCFCYLNYFINNCVIVLAIFVFQLFYLPLQLISDFDIVGLLHKKSV